MSKKLEDFEPLWPAEAKFINEMHNGAVVRIGDEIPEKIAHDISFRASFLRYLALGGCEKAKPSEKGIRLRGAHIESDGPIDSETSGIDLENCVVIFDIFIFRCSISSPILLRGARIESLILDRCKIIGGLSGERLETRGPLLIRMATIFGLIRLTSAHIGNGIDFSGSVFHGEELSEFGEYHAVLAQNMQCDGSLLLSNSKYYGKINLDGALISGQLSAKQSIFSYCDIKNTEISKKNSECYSFMADNINVRDAILIFECYFWGEARFNFAVIGSSIELDHSKFHSTRQNADETYALRADALTTKGDISLRYVIAKGAIRLRNATVSLDIDCSYGKFHGDEHAAQSSQRAIDFFRVSASQIKFTNVKAEGEISLLYARCDSISFNNGSFYGHSISTSNLGYSISLDRSSISGSVFIDKSVFSGEFRLTGSQIRAFQCTSGEFYAKSLDSFPEKYALCLDYCILDSNIIVVKSKIIGSLILFGSSISGNLDLTDTIISNGSDNNSLKSAIIMIHTKIIGAFIAKGNYRCQGIFNATSAEIGLIDDDPAGWPAKGDLKLDRCRYNGFAGGIVDVKQKLDWINLQYPKESSKVFFPQTHNHLSKILIDNGQDNDAKTVLIEKERRHRRADTAQVGLLYKIPSHLINMLFFIVGDGVRPARALIPALLFVICGALLIEKAKNMDSLIAVKNEENGVSEPVLFPLVYSLEAFAPLVNLGQVRQFKPNTAKPWGYWTQIYLWLHGLAGWLIGGIAAAGILGLFRRS